MKPVTCKHIGCGGPSCKHYRSTDKYPYFECGYFDDCFEKDDDDEKDEED